MKLKLSDTSNFNTINNELELLNLQSLQHRILHKLFTFIHKIIYFDDSPQFLKTRLVFNTSLNKNYLLRNETLLALPMLSYLNNYGERTFEYFFSIFINELCTNNLFLPFNLFKNSTFNNINIYFEKFIILFPKFDLNYPNFDLNYYVSHSD